MIGINIQTESEKKNLESFAENVEELIKSRLACTVGKALTPNMRNYVRQLIEGWLHEMYLKKLIFKETEDRDSRYAYPVVCTKCGRYAEIPFAIETKEGFDPSAVDICFVFDGNWENLLENPICDDCLYGNSIKTAREALGNGKVVITGKEDKNG